MYQLHDFSVYHPNSYIASRRSSLPRQGYGGVYERQVSSPWPATRHRDLKPFPRHLSEYSFWAASPDRQSAAIRQSATEASLCTAAAPPAEEESSGKEQEVTEKEEEVEGEEEAPSPVSEPAEVRITRRQRGAEEHRLVEAVSSGRRARGEACELPSDLLQRVAGDLLGLELKEGQSNSSGGSEDPGEAPSEAAWNLLLSELLAAKKLARSALDREYREAKRRVTQLRHMFEKRPEHVLSRFDRLVSDITCLSRLACQLARQSARLGQEAPPVPEASPAHRPIEALMEEKRRGLDKQLAELPRLRASLLARQGSLSALLADCDSRELFGACLETFWSSAAHLAVLEAEIALDAELSSIG